MKCFNCGADLNQPFCGTCGQLNKDFVTEQAAAEEATEQAVNQAVQETITRVMNGTEEISTDEPFAPVTPV